MWDSTLPNLRFDQAAAAAAADACRQAARRLALVMDHREQAARTLRASWWGPHADAFGEQHRRELHTGRMRVDQLHRHAAQIEAIARRAAAEQRSRDRHNARLLAERAASRAAAWSAGPAAANPASPAQGSTPSAPRGAAS